MDTTTSLADSQKSASTLLFCRMCQSVYREPKLLPCLHTFCRPCLVSAVTSVPDGTVIVCPMCSHETRLPVSGVDGVPDNCFLNRMCQEYLTEFQNHLMARSLYPSAKEGTSEFPAPSSRLNNELSKPKYSPLTHPRSQYNGQEDTQIAKEESLPQVLSIDRGPASGQSTASALEAIRNMSRLQTKVMSLQGDALRVTYAIDQVNQCTTDWNQHKEDLKRAIQRRSAQFQFFIKRLEHQLTAQVDSKQADDIFYKETNKSKTDLRKNLNSILHEVSVLKSVQELGKDAEINALSASLLGKSAGLTDVVLKKLHFDLELPTKTIEEIVTAHFGEVKLNFEESKVFTPENLDFTSLPVGSSTEPVVGVENSTSYGRETPIEEYRELGNVDINKSSKKKPVDRRSRRHNTDLGLDKEDVKEYLAQFQNARETFSARRREILARGQQAHEDASPLREEIQRRPRSPSMRGRVQSLDRVAIPTTTRGRTVLPSRTNVQEVKTSKAILPDILSPDFEAGTSQSETTLKFEHEAGGSHIVPELIPENVSNSSATEEVPFPTSPQRKLVKQTSDPRYSGGVHYSPEEPLISQVSSSSHSQSLLEQLRSRRLSNPNSRIFTERRHSDQILPLSPGEHTALHLLEQDRIMTRPARRSFSSAADRRAKIDFLRENWQKRKEILIQNEGFVSPDTTTKQVARQLTQVQLPVLADSPSSKAMTSDTVEKTGPISPPPASSDDPRVESMHQIRSRIAQYRNELTKMDDALHKDVKTNIQSYPSLHTSEKPISNVKAQEGTAVPTATSPTATAAQTVPQTIISNHISVSPTASSTSIPQQPRAATSLVQTTSPSSPISPSVSTTITSSSVLTTASPSAPATTTSPSAPATTSHSDPTTTTRSRYSKYLAYKTETIDVASLIAAMYSGNEKKLIHENTPTSDTFSKPSETSQATAITTTTATTISSTTTESTGSRATTLPSVASTTAYRYQTETHKDTAQPRLANQTYSTKETEESAQQSQPRLSRYGLYSRYTDQTPSNTNANVTTTPSSNNRNVQSVSSAASIITSANISTSTPYKHQDNIQSDTTPPMQDDQTNSSEQSESTQRSRPRQSRHGLRSRYTDGVNRRHTIEIGKSDIKNALQMISQQDTSGVQQTSLHSISESPVSNHTPVYTPYQSRFADSSSRKLESTNGTTTPLSSSAGLMETDEIEDSIISYKIRASGVTTKIIPSPLEVIQEKSLLDHSHTPETTAPTAEAPGTPTSPSPSPTSPNANDVAQKVRLREIARKKKERWRHLTVH